MSPVGRTFVECSHCGSPNTEEIKREPVTTKHFTDHRIRYRCKDCGEITEKGA
jgi:translation initiation factor 2 beta subunit (eIF-2beta)/eIF-5